MAGHKGMKRRDDRVLGPQPCIEAGTANWLSWSEVAEKSDGIYSTHGNELMTHQNLCLIGTKALTKIAKEVVLIMGGSMPPRELIGNPGFLQLVEEELTIFKRPISGEEE